VQDQDFGTVAVAHPDGTLTDQIMGGVAARMYEELTAVAPPVCCAPSASSASVSSPMCTGHDADAVHEDVPRAAAERAVTWGIVEAAVAHRWLDGFTALVAAGGLRPAE